MEESHEAKKSRLEPELWRLFGRFPAAEAGLTPLKPVALNKKLPKKLSRIGKKSGESPETAYRPGKNCGKRHPRPWEIAKSCFSRKKSQFCEIERLKRRKNRIYVIGAQRPNESESRAKVKGQSAGSTYLTAKKAKNNIKAYCFISVRPVKVFKLKNLDWLKSREIKEEARK